MSQLHTAALGLPYPDGSSAADVPFDIEALAQALDGQAAAWFPSPGDIKLSAAIAAPTGWLFCDGAVLDRATYAALYAAIGDTYGAGDGSTTFSLPDLRMRLPLGAGLNHPLGERGGEETHALALAELPAHGHPVSDPGHGHGVSDPGHGHGVNDPGHNHGGYTYSNTVAGGWTMPTTNGGWAQSWTGEGGGGAYHWVVYSNGSLGQSDGNHPHGIPAGGTGIGIAGSGTGVGVVAGATGVGVGNAGGDGAHNNMPPFAVVHYVIKT